MKYLGINLIKKNTCILYLYTEHYTTLLRKIKDHPNKWRGKACLWVSTQYCSDINLYQVDL